MGESRVPKAGFLLRVARALQRATRAGALGAALRRRFGESLGRESARQLRFVGESVADAIDGLNVSGRAAVRLELPAQVLDVRVDRSFIRLEGHAANGFQQLRASE